MEKAWGRWDERLGDTDRTQGDCKEDERDLGGHLAVPPSLDLIIVSTSKSHKENEIIHVNYLLQNMGHRKGLVNRSWYYYGNTVGTGLEVFKMNENVPAYLECRVHGLSYRRRNQTARGRQESWVPALTIISFIYDNNFLKLNCSHS